MNGIDWISRSSRIACPGKVVNVGFVIPRLDRGIQEERQKQQETGDFYLSPWIPRSSRGMTGLSILGHPRLDRGIQKNNIVIPRLDRGNQEKQAE